MAELLFDKSVRLITGLEKDRMGQMQVFRIYRKKGKKKRKVSTLLTPQERALRRTAEAENTFSTEFLRRHEKSNRKKKNGFLRELPENINRAYRKALKSYYK
jgi:hypothetical protein